MGHHGCKPKRDNTINLSILHSLPTNKKLELEPLRKYVLIRSNEKASKQVGAASFLLISRTDSILSTSNLHKYSQVTSHMNVSPPVGH